MAVSTQHGGCHCGAVRYQVEIDIEAEALSCNCSMCGRSGTLLQFVPESAFKLEQGEQNLTDYQFKAQLIHHAFCSTCGISSYGWGTAPDGSKMFSVNVRCLEGVDLGALKVTEFDGKSL